jgi:hypothetical protein
MTNLQQLLNDVEHQYALAQEAANRAAEHYQQTGAAAVAERRLYGVGVGDRAYSSAATIAAERAEEALQAANSEVIRLGKIRAALRQATKN